MKTRIIDAILCAAAILLAGYSAVMASVGCVAPATTTINMQVTWPGSPLSNYSFNNDTDPTLPELVKYFFEWGVGLGGLGVFIALVIAGVQYITSVADPGKVKDARERIKSSLIGLVLLLSSWAIFNLINPSLNSMQNLPDISKKIIDGKIMTSDTCNANYNCCEIKGCDKAVACAGLPGGANDPNCCVDFGCAPENWLCCEQNNVACINGDDTAALAKGAVGNGTHCDNSSDCQSGYCDCDKTDWTAKCYDNPKICIQTQGQAKLGCDFVVAYSGADFTGTAATTTSDNPSAWEEPPFTIRSYQAYKYATNRKGDYVTASGATTTTAADARLISCGATACGCKITLCQFPAAGGPSCSDGGTDYAWAFEKSVGQNYKSIQIKDDTKGYTGAASSVANGIIDTIKGWLPFKIH